MGWGREIETTPGKAADDLKALEPPKRKGEAEQMASVAKLAASLVEKVSKRERVLISIGGHDDEGGEGFNGRYISLAISRVDPEAIRQREAEAERIASIEQREAELAAEAETDPAPGAGTAAPSTAPPAGNPQDA
jgi:hypothetical protein